MTDLTDNPNKKTFKEMTDDEQGALLLAKHKGEIIQHFASLQYVDWCDWVDNKDEEFMIMYDLIFNKFYYILIGILIGFMINVLFF